VFPGVINKYKSRSNRETQTNTRPARSWPRDPLITAVWKAGIEVVRLQGIGSAPDMPGAIRELGIEQKSYRHLKRFVPELPCCVQGVESLPCSVGIAWQSV